MAKNNGCAALFDLDGVVIDSIESIWMATRDLLEEGGVSFFDLPDLTHFLKVFSVPGIDFCRSYGIEQSAEELINRFLEIAPSYELLDEPYLGMERVITELRARGWATAIVSASQPAGVGGKLKKFGLAELFDAVYAGEEDKTSAIGICCSQLGCSPSRTCFIGDLKSDMRDGRAASVIPIGFAAGRGFMVPVLQAAGARICVHEPEELLVVIPEVLAES